MYVSSMSVRWTVKVRQISLEWEKSIKLINLAILWSTLHSLLWNQLRGPEQMRSLLSWLPLVPKQESQTVQLKARASEDKISNEFMPSMNQAWGWDGQKIGNTYNKLIS